MKRYDELARHLQTDDNEGHDILDQISQEYNALLAACKWTARGEHHRACSHYRKNPNACDCYVGACKSAIEQAGESGE